MLVVKNAMVLTHFAKLSVLGTACAYFGDVGVPTRVHEETVDAGRDRGYLGA